MQYMLAIVRRFIAGDLDVALSDYNLKSSRKDNQNDKDDREG